MTATATKTLLKWICAASNFPTRLIRQMLAYFFGVERLYQSSGKRKENGRLVFPSSTKREIRHFHVVVVQRWQRNVQKSVMHLQSCYFANLNLLVFCHSRCRRRRRCWSSLLLKHQLKYLQWSLPPRSLHPTAEQRAQVFYRTTNHSTSVYFQKGHLLTLTQKRLKRKLAACTGQCWNWPKPSEMLQDQEEWLTASKARSTSSKFTSHSCRLFVILASESGIGNR